MRKVMSVLFGFNMLCCFIIVKPVCIYSKEDSLKLANAYYDKGSYKKAKECFQKAVITGNIDSVLSYSTKMIDELNEDTLNSTEKISISNAGVTGNVTKIIDKFKKVIKKQKEENIYLILILPVAVLIVFTILRINSIIISVVTNIFPVALSLLVEHKIFDMQIFLLTGIAFFFVLIIGFCLSGGSWQHSKKDGSKDMRFKKNHYNEGDFTLAGNAFFSLILLVILTIIFWKVFKMGPAKLPEGGRLMDFLLGLLIV